MRLIDAEPLYKKYLELEKQARECQMDYLDHCKADSPNVIKWSAILIERIAYKFDLLNAPTVNAVPVVRCKDCAYYENCLDTYMIPADCCPQGKRKEETE